jgi:hypothetical protein
MVLNYEPFKRYAILAAQPEAKPIFKPKRI